MVMNANGNNAPGTTGPPPAVYWEKAGAFNSGFTMITPSTRNPMVPIFMNELR
jgi:hypothetical protein